MTLLFFLRTAKFSQLRARTLVENYAKAITNFPHWFRDIDTHKPDLIEAIDRGYELCISTASGDSRQTCVRRSAHNGDRIVPLVLRHDTTNSVFAY